jgi:hypothetical protein
MGAPLGNKNALKVKIWTQALKRALARIAVDKFDVDQGLDQIADKVVSLALGGDQFAIKEIGDRMEGKAVQIIGGDEDAPIVLKEIVIRAIDATQDRPSQEGD